MGGRLRLQAGCLHVAGMFKTSTEAIEICDKWNKAANDARQSWHSHFLGIEPAATRAEIHRAYRRLAKRLHPDRGGTDADMARLNDALALALADRRAPNPEPGVPPKRAQQPNIWPSTPERPPESTTWHRRSVPPTTNSILGARVVLAVIALVGGSFFGAFVWPLVVAGSR
jgi:DnaJ domain